MRTGVKITLVVGSVLFLGALLAAGLTARHFWLRQRHATDLILRYRIVPLNPEDKTAPDIAEPVAKSVQRRIDPAGAYDLECRRASVNEIEVRVPSPGPAWRAALDEFDQALAAVADLNLREDAVRDFLGQPAAAREARVAALGPVAVERRALLLELAQANDQWQATTTEVAEAGDDGSISEELLQSRAEARRKVHEARTALRRSNVGSAHLQRLLLAAEDPAAAEARAQLAKLPENYPPAVRAALDRVLDAHEKLMGMRGSGPDPRGVDRLVTSPGRLEFRVAVRRDEIDTERFGAALVSLEEKGPDVPIEKMRWCAIDILARDDVREPRCIVQTWEDEPYVLMYDDADHTLLNRSALPEWDVARARVGMDESSGGPVVSFSFDSRGAALFARLTGRNVGQVLAILIDDRVVSAPNLRSPILGGSGQITFGARASTTMRDEAERIGRVLQAGTYPAVRLERIH